METLKELLSSKKFWMTVFGAVLWPILISFVPALEPLEEHITEIIGVVIAFILGQGLADFGKHSQ